MSEPGWFGYSGRREYDAETGLYDYRARMYCPQLGRFLQPDPIGYADSMNLYQYCGNNPINWVDPLGLVSECSPQGAATVAELAAGGDLTVAEAAALAESANKVRKVLKKPEEVREIGQKRSKNNC